MAKLSVVHEADNQGWMKEPCHNNPGVGGRVGVGGGVGAGGVGTGVGGVEDEGGGMAQ